LSANKKLVVINKGDGDGKESIKRAK